MSYMIVLAVMVAMTSCSYSVENDRNQIPGSDWAVVFVELVPYLEPCHYMTIPGPLDLHDFGAAELLVYSPRMPRLK